MHIGVIAQRVEKAFADAGLDACAFGLLCHDTWPAVPEEIVSWSDEYDDSGNLVREAGTEVVREAMPAGDRYGVRYEEALALESALMRRSMYRLEALIANLEARSLK